MNRLFVQIERKSLQPIEHRYPFLYVERCRIEVDDSSIKLIFSNGDVVPVQASLILSLMLGPGTSITHEAIKALSSSSVTVGWVSEDSFHFHAFGISPTHDTKRMAKQISASSSSKRRVEIARRMFSYRFTDEEIGNKNLKDLMAMEGRRQRELYAHLSDYYGIKWRGRKAESMEIPVSDLTNRLMTYSNAYLYGIVTAVTHSLGLTPYVGFIHSGSPLPFIYDIADIYKPHFSIDLAFKLTKEMRGEFDRKFLEEAFRERLVEDHLVSRIPKDIKYCLGF